MTLPSIPVSLLPIVVACAVVALACRNKLARCLGVGNARAANVLRTLISSLERRPDLEDEDRAELLAARVALDAWQSGPCLTILPVDHEMFVYTAFALLNRVWERVALESLPAGRYVLPVKTRRRFRR
jgi:hypothetical protein